MASPTTWSEFKVDLGELYNAIGIIKNEHDLISDLLDHISSEFEACRNDWDTPAAVTFDSVKTWLTTAATDLNALLDEMVTRMRTAYDNYKNAEETNISNLEARDGSGSGGGSDSGSGGGGKKKGAGKGDGKHLLKGVVTNPENATSGLFKPIMANKM